MCDAYFYTKTGMTETQHDWAKQCPFFIVLEFSGSSSIAEHNGCTAYNQEIYKTSIYSLYGKALSN